MKFFVSTGEASGDLHLSYLVKSVKARYKDVDFVGVAGEKSKKEGVEILQDISELAIMGFTEAIKKYKFLKQKAYEYLQYIKDNQIEKIKQLWVKLGNKEHKKKVESILRKGFLYGDIKKAISSLEEEEE